MKTNHPALSPMIGRSNVATLAAEFRRLELHEHVPAGAEAYRRAGELLMSMWQAAVIATNAANLEISETPLGEDESTAIRRRLEQLWHEAKLSAEASPSGEAGEQISRMEVIADVIEDLEGLDLVPTLGEVLEGGNR